MAEPGPLQPAMTAGEVAVLRECLSKAASLVEFGCGGSTLVAAQSRSLRRIWSVESDPAWLDTLRGQPDAVAAERDGRLTLAHADIGPVGPFGVPVDDRHRAAWPRYHEAVWNDPETLGTDLVLVDGRFRVACALQAVARCSPHTVVLFHDFWNRTPYHPVLAFTDWLGSCDSLAILRRKPSLDAAQLRVVLDAHRFVPD
jgi:hypothetical protein